jgi:hypothetical protein
MILNPKLLIPLRLKRHFVDMVYMVEVIVDILVNTMKENMAIDTIRIYLDLLDLLDGLIGGLRGLCGMSIKV